MAATITSCSPVISVNENPQSHDYGREAGQKQHQRLGTLRAHQTVLHHSFTKSSVERKDDLNDADKQ